MGGIGGNRLVDLFNLRWCDPFPLVRCPGAATLAGRLTAAGRANKVAANFREMPVRPMILALALVAAPAAAQTPGEAWWHHVEVIAADDMNGRQTGSADFDRAAAYVIARFKEYGLVPAGSAGFRQPVALEQQIVDQEASRGSLTAPSGTTPLAIGDDILISAGGPRPEAVEAPLVFAGYGLSIPESGHDDFAGLDLNGKILVVISGGPANIPGALKSHARSERARMARARGAVGILTLNTPKAVEIPWDRARLLAHQPGMYLADAALRTVPGAFFGGAIDPAKADRFFAASGHSFADIAALADASKPVPTFALNQTLKATIVARRSPVASYNILAKLPGSDPALKAETVAISAHIDHLGVGDPIAGDRIYNGAMDDGSGVATVLEIARQYARDRARPKRSILFAIVTAEEKGLLGSDYLARRPTPAAGRIVADLNFDMPLPLFPLKSVLVLGADESSIGAAAHAVGQRMGLPLVPDPVPDRNAFIRSDQYSFVHAGVPAVGFKFGFAAGSPEAAIEKAWRTAHYHAPSDDPAQPVEKEEAVKLNRFVAALGLAIADAPNAPTWNETSFFKRFAK